MRISFSRTRSRSLAHALCLAETPTGASAQTSKENELTAAKVQITQLKAQLAEANAQIALLSADKKNEDNDKDTAEPVRKLNFVATIMEEVDHFKTAFDALDSGLMASSSLRSQNQPLLERVLPAMIAFAGLDEEEKARVVSMLGSRGRLLEEKIRQAAIAVTFLSVTSCGSDVNDDDDSDDDC